MKTFFYLLTAFSILFISSCSKDCDCADDSPPATQYPTLTIVNQNNNEAYLTSVRLLNYDFTNLNIEIGDSQTFRLDAGMPGGHENINIIVAWSRSIYQGGTVNSSFDFVDGENTTIIFDGCISYSGCEGFYIEE